MSNLNYFTNEPICTSEYPFYISTKEILNFASVADNFPVWNNSIFRSQKDLYIELKDNKSFSTVKDLEEYINGAPCALYGRRYKYVSSIFNTIKNRLENLAETSKLYSIRYNNNIPEINVDYVNEVNYDIEFVTCIVIHCIAKPFSKYHYIVENSNNPVSEDFKITVNYNVGHNDWVDYDTFSLGHLDTFFNSEYIDFSKRTYNIYESVVKNNVKKILEEKIKSANEIIERTERELKIAKDVFNDLNKDLATHVKE